ncbi:MAG: MBL fold metallo-hydrolase [Sphingomonas sp.]|nr:MBL fold metallo-hydrolase [Sphingomonas sp.]
MIFRQLIEPESSTYTYLVACEETREAALIDPVLQTLDRDLALLEKLGLALKYTIETHIHADHVTAADRLRDATGSNAAVPEKSGARNADIAIREGEPIFVGKLRLEPLYVPGHTDDHHAYLLRSSDGARVFTGDALMIDGCGRTDFQNGDAATLYRSVHEKLFTLPDETLVYPGHDYQLRFVSSIGQEKARNPRLGGGKTLQEFVEIMNNLNLPRPKKMDVAVPANRSCGEMHSA